jgi:cytidine deaminase
MDKKSLIECAIEARELAYNPYSHFAVGAAILCHDGSVYVGANIENASYPLSMCAERNALYNAMMDGKSQDDFEALAIVADCERPVSPCGACRQVLSELFPPEAPIYLANLKGNVMETTISELLPYAFNEDDL